MTAVASIRRDLELHVAVSPITNRIYAGKVLKDGTWGVGKTDVTGEACAAVAKCVLAHGEPLVVTANGKERYRISVVEIEN